MRADEFDEPHRPLYARALRLHYVAPSGFLCFVFLEGAIALGVLLALAELVSWWGVVVLPALVAVMVKLNDVFAGSLSRPAPRARPLRAATAGGPAARAHDDTSLIGPVSLRDPGDAAAETGGGMPSPGESTTRLPGVIHRDQGAPIMRPWAEQAEAQQQRVRHSATRRYE